MSGESWPRASALRRRAAYAAWPARCTWTLATTSASARRPRPAAYFTAVPATVIVGAQWGDEGKGKIVDLLAQHSDVVCRYQGGPNAGHTIIAEGETFKIRQIPSGIVLGKPCVIGAGCVVDPEVLIAELELFEGRGQSTDEV